MTTASSGLFSTLFDHGDAGVGDQAWLQAMLDVEAGLARALERAGLAPPGAGAAVTEAARAELFDVALLGSRAAAAGNPVPALVKELTGRVPEFAASAIHRGATSQDIMDSAAVLIARRVLNKVRTHMTASADAAAALAASHRDTIMAGRTLLQQAVPVTFGLIAAGWLTALDDASTELERVCSQRLAVQLGGAAGTLSVFGQSGLEVVALLADELSLPVPVLPWHTDRLRIVQLAAAMAGVCAVTGKIARDVTLLGQTEVAEVSEGPGTGRRRDDSDACHTARGGSSAMPHKRNPVAAVLVLGCARRAPMLVATLTAAAEHELQRAAGSWHAEWEPFADLLRITSSAAAWTADLLAGLEVNASRMQANLAAAHELPMAEQVAAVLTPTLGRLPALDLIARASREAAASGRDLSAILISSPDFAAALTAAGIGAAELTAAVDPARSLGAADAFISAALRAHRSSCESHRTEEDHDRKSERRKEDA